MIKKIFVILVLMISITKAEFKFAGNIISFQNINGHLEFELENSLLNIYIIKDNIVRFRYTNKNEFSKAPSYAVIYKQPANISYQIEDKGEYYLLRTQRLNIKISKFPCRISIYDEKMNLINEDEKSFGVSFDNDEVRCFKKLFDDEHFYGLGEKSGFLEKKGSQYTMWNTDFPAYTYRTDPLYESIPFFIGVRKKKAYGIFFDNTYKSYFNMGASNNRFYWFGADKGEMDYYFIYGPKIKDAITSYTLLTGRMTLPPLWALGYQQSKWSYYPESTVKRIAKTFRDKKIPCDVIYLDIDYMDGYRVFTWNKKRFPEPPKMLAGLKQNGFKIIPIIDPGVKADTNYFAAKEGIAKDLFAKYPDGVLYQGEVWPSWAYFPDFTKLQTRLWWAEKLSVLLNQGVEGFWNDMNEPSVWGQAFPDIVMFDDNGFIADHKKIHNVYALQMARATFNGLKKYSPDVRHFILTRAGFAGIQRYSAVWTGDNEANEEHLKLACTMSQGLGLSGVPFVGSDVGGFIGVPTANLYIRWMQLGAFTPFFRGHSVRGTKDKEPWAFGEDVENIVRDIINLRYKLLPLLYTEFYNASKTGLPVMSPMMLNYQNDDNSYLPETQYQYMVGKNLLVAPVVVENDLFKRVYLPEGRWMNYWDGKIYNGKQWIIISAPLNQIPLFIREGGVIPMQEVQQYVGEKKIDELKLLFFPSVKKNVYTLYEDDGISYNFENGESLLTDITSAVDESYGTIKFNSKGNYKPDRKYFLLKIMNTKNIKEVYYGNVLLNKIKAEKALTSANEGYYYDSNNKILYVKVKSKGTAEVKYMFN